MNFQELEFDYTIGNTTHTLCVDINLEEYSEVIANETVHLNNYGSYITDPILHDVKYKYLKEKVISAIKKNNGNSGTFIIIDQKINDLMEVIDNALKGYLDEVESNPCEEE